MKRIDSYDDIAIDDRFRHYKGGEYKVVGFAIRSSDPPSDGNVEIIYMDDEGGWHVSAVSRFTALVAPKRFTKLSSRI